jgi:hypothetical protein
MKKLFVLLVATAVAVGASAGVSFKSNHSVKHNKIINTEMTKLNSKEMKAKASLRVITDQPEGELKTYNRAGNAVYVSGGYLTAGEQSGRMNIVYAEDGKVYLNNILMGCGGYFGNSWVEGYIDGNELRVPLGQSIYWSDDYQADVVIAMGTSRVEGTTLYFDVDDRATEAVYVIDGETISLQGTYAAPSGSEYPDYEGYGLGCYWTDDNSFGGFNEWNTVLTEREPVVTPEVITEIPATCEIETYYRSSYYIANSIFGIGQGSTDGKINVAFDQESNDVYVQNPVWYYDYDYNNVWVKGTLDRETGIISIPTGQYLNWYDEDEYGIQLVWGYTYVYEDGVDEETGEPNYYLGYAIDERTTEIQLQLNEDASSFILLGSQGDVNAEFPFNYEATGMMTVWSDDQSMTSLEFTAEGEPMGYIVNLVPAVPADPTADEWYDCGDESGFSYFYFTLPTTDVDGNMIDPEYLSYSIYIDYNEEPFTFPAADYTYDLTEDITEVPYSLYSSAVDFRDYFVYMYRTNAEGYEPLFTQNIGIQAIYTVNGERNASNIVWLYPGEDTKVNELNAGKTVANVRYFNVAGQEMAQPEGMTIKVTTYTDGTTSAVKVVK